MVRRPVAKLALLVCLYGGCRSGDDRCEPRPPLAPIPRWIPDSDVPNARAFGAIGDGVSDDTAAIQAAIDSLRNWNWITFGEVAIGGIVHLPAGVYRVSAPLRVPSAVLLKGDGAESTSILASDTDAVILARHEGTWFFGQGGVEDLAIRTGAPGTVAVRSMPGSYQVWLRRLVVSAGGIGIDIGASYHQGGTIEDVRFVDMGSSALRIVGNANVYRRLRVEGRARPGFQPERGLFWIEGGGNLIEDLDVTGDYPPCVSYHLRDFALLRDVRTGVDGADGVAYDFEAFTGTEMEIFGVTPSRRVRLTRCEMATFARLQADAIDPSGLSSVLEMDAASTAVVHGVEVPASFGGTIADEPRVQVDRVVRASASDRTSTYAPPAPAAACGDVPLSVPYPHSTDLVGTATTVQISVADFGATGNGWTDDTDAIQAALDSVPAPGPLSHGRLPVAAVVSFPHGNYLVSRPIVVTPGKFLVGRNNGSTIFSRTSDLLHFAAGASGWAWGGIAGFGLRTDRPYRTMATAPGVTAIHLETDRLLLVPGGRGIDFEGVYAHRCHIDRTYVVQLGGVGMWISGDWNRVVQFDVEGHARDMNLQASPATFVLEGGRGNLLEGCIVEPFDSPGLAYYLRGDGLHFTSCWGEQLPTADGYSFHLDDLHDSRLHMLHHANGSQRVRISGSTGNRIGWISTNGDGSVLSQIMTVDDASTVMIETVDARWDAGWLDHPRVKVESVFSRRGNCVIRNPIAVRSVAPSDPAGWIAWSGSDLPVVRETDPVTGRARFVVDLPANPGNLPLSIGFDVSGLGAADSGRPAVVVGRFDGPMTVAMIWWYDGQAQDYLDLGCRSVNTKTSARVPALRNGDRVYWTTGLPAIPGRYVLSDVAVGFQESQ